MATTKTKTVDFAPEYGLDGDFKKISEYDFFRFNSRLQPVLTLIYMEKGTNQLIPDMGLYEMFMKIPFTERPNFQDLINEIKRQLSTYSTENCTVSLGSRTDWTIGDIYLNIDIEGVPAPLQVKVNKEAGGTIKVAHPSLFK